MNIDISDFPQLDIQVGDLFLLMSPPPSPAQAAQRPPVGPLGQTGQFPVKNGAQRRSPTRAVMRLHQRRRCRAGEIEGERGGPARPARPGGKPWSARSGRSPKEKFWRRIQASQAHRLAWPFCARRIPCRRCRVCVRERGPRAVKRVGVGAGFAGKVGFGARNRGGWGGAGGKLSVHTPS